MAYSRKLIFKCSKSIGEVSRKKVLKIILPEKYYLLQKMQTILNVETLSSRNKSFAKNVRVLCS